MAIPSTTERRETFLFLTLPQDVLRLIVKDYLKPEERIAVQFVNKKFCVLVSDLSKKTTSFEIINSIASFGHIPLVDWALSFLRYKHLAVWTHSAARHGQLRLLAWLRENGCPWNKEGCAEQAAEGGHLNVLKWLHEKKYPFTPFVFAEAAKKGDLEVLKWLYLMKCPWDDFSVSYAAERGHLEVIKWLRENGCPWYKGAYYSAAKEGHLTLLKWLHANGCPDLATSVACLGAAQGGHLETLKWVRENGGEWNGKEFAWAALYGHLEILKYLYENGFLKRDDYDYIDLVSRVKGRGHTQVFHWLIEKGFS